MTKAQHYVWRKYLEPWTDNNDYKTGTVFVRRKNPKGNQATIENQLLTKVGFEKYYYDISGFTDNDIALCHKFISNFQKDTYIKLGIDFSLLKDAQAQRDFIEQEIISPAENIDNTYKFLDLIKNGNIDFYKDSKSQVILDMLKEKTIECIFNPDVLFCESDANFVLNEFFNNIDEPDLKHKFIEFFCFQYFRSPRRQASLSDVLTEIKNKYEIQNDWQSHFFAVVISFFFAMEMTLNLSQNIKTFLTLLTNKSSIPFITSDTPIVNISSNDKIGVFYYPVSPTRAIILQNTDKHTENAYQTITSEDEIQKLNKKLYINCFNEAYSNDKFVINDESLSE